MAFKDVGGEPPSSLGKRQLTAIADTVGMKLTAVGPWTLTPAKPLIVGRADLAFHSSHLVDLTTYDAPAAYFLAPGTLELRFHPPTVGARYLVDCAVRNDGTIFNVEVYPGGTEQSFANTSHLVVIYEAASTARATIRIQGDKADDTAWKFYWCEMRPLE